jgi:hypothetical protein
MSYFQKAFDEILYGLENEVNGIPYPFKKLEPYLDDIRQKTYYLVGGAAKSGKTSLADTMFLYSSYDYYKEQKAVGNPANFDLQIDYYSFEIDIISKIHKGISYKLWKDYNILIAPTKLKKLRKNHDKAEIIELVSELRDYFEELEDVCTIYQHPDNPTGIHKQLMKRAYEHGEVVTKNINEDVNGTPILRFDKYIPKNNNLYRFCFIDHVSLVPEEKGYNTKQNIDKLSSYLVMHRNNFSLSPVVVQQLSFEVTNDDRFKSNRLTPTTRDFSDSRYTIRDCNVAITLFNPSELHLETFHNYNINKLGNSFRNLEVLVNRDGEPNINLGLNFIGTCGTFRELPIPDEMNDLRYKYAYSMDNAKSKYVKNENGIWQLR